MQGCQPPTTLNTENSIHREGDVDDVITYSTTHDICSQNTRWLQSSAGICNETKAQKRCWHCNILPDWFTSHQSHYLPWHTRILQENLWCLQFTLAYQSQIHPATGSHFSTTEVYVFKTTWTTGLLVISFVWGRIYTSSVAEWPHTGRIYTPISIKVASEKTMFHSPQCIIVASLVNDVPATSLET